MQQGKAGFTGQGPESNGRVRAQDARRLGESPRPISHAVTAIDLPAQTGTAFFLKKTKNQGNLLWNIPTITVPF